MLRMFLRSSTGHVETETLDRDAKLNETQDPETQMKN